LCLFLAASVMALSGLWVTPLSNHLPVWEVVGLRCIFTFLFVASYMGFTGKPHLSGKLGVELLMGAVGGLLILLYFYAIWSVGVSVAALLLYTSPFFAAVLSAALLGERFGLRHVAALTMSFSGMVLILKPGFSMDLGLLAGLMSGVLYGFRIVLNRMLAGVDSSWTMTYYYMLVPSAAFVAYVLVQPAGFVMPSLSDVPPLAGLVVVSSALGLLLQHQGFILVEAAEGSVIMMFEAVGAAFLGVIVFSEALSLSTVIGGILVVASGAYLSFKR
jgi:drug/metabolite transporter (DMT)-like permease